MASWARPKSICQCCDPTRWQISFNGILHPVLAYLFMRLSGTPLQYIDGGLLIHNSKRRELTRDWSHPLDGAG
jgi:hypothetical protein